MNPYSIILLGIFIAIVILTFNTPSVKKTISQPKVCFSEHCFQVELAITPTQRAKGLMFRKSLEEDTGMLFVYTKEGIRSFWMKNTLIPLDIVWLDSAGKVVHVHQNAQPCGKAQCNSIKPNQKAKYVLEVGGGVVGKLGIEVGNVATILL